MTTDQLIDWLNKTLDAGPVDAPSVAGAVWLISAKTAVEIKRLGDGSWDVADVSWCLDG